MKALRKIDEVLTAAKDLVETSEGRIALLRESNVTLPHDATPVGRSELTRLEMAIKGLKEVGGR